MAGIRLDKEKLLKLIEYNYQLGANSPLSETEKSVLDSLGHYLGSGLSEKFGEQDLNPVIVEKLISGEDASLFLGDDVLRSWTEFKGKDKSFKRFINIPQGYFYPSNLYVNNTSNDRTDVSENDRVQIRDESGRALTIGRVMAVTEEGAYICFNSYGRDMGGVPLATAFYSNNDLINGLPHHWQIVHAGTTRQLANPVDKYPRVQRVTQSSEAVNLRDPRELALHQFKLYLDTLTAKRSTAYASYIVIEKESKGKRSMGRYLYNITHSDSVDVSGWDVDRLRKYKVEIERLDSIKAEVLRLIEKLEVGGLPDISDLDSYSPMVSYILTTNFTDSKNNIVIHQLETARKLRQEEDYEDAVQLVAAGVWGYRYNRSVVAGSIERNPDGSRSLTSTINELIQNGHIRVDDKPYISSAEELEQIRYQIFGTFGYNSRAMSSQTNATRFADTPYLPIISKEEFDAEMERLSVVDEHNENLRQTYDMLLAEQHLLVVDIGEANAGHFIPEFGKGLMEMLDDPATVAMILAGGAAGAVGRSLMIRLATAGFGATSTALIGLTVEGIVFHNLNNAAMAVIEPDAELDWGISGNIHSIATLGWLKAVGLAHGKLAERTYLQLRKTHPILYGAIHHPSLVASETAAFAVQGVMEMEGDLSLDSIEKVLTHSVQQVIAFKAYRFGGGARDHGEKLKEIDEKIAKVLSNVQGKFLDGEVLWGRMEVLERTRLTELFVERNKIATAALDDELLAINHMELQRSIGKKEAAYARRNILAQREALNALSGRVESVASVEKKFVSVIERFSGSEPMERVSALDELVTAVPNLPEGERRVVVEIIIGMVRDENNAVACDLAIDALKEIMPYLSDVEQRAIIEIFVQRVADDSGPVRLTAASALTLSLELLSETEREKVVESIVRVFSDKDPSKRFSTILAVWNLIPFLPDTRQRQYVEIITQRLGDDEAKVRKVTIHVLEKTVPLLPQTERLPFILNSVVLPAYRGSAEALSGLMSELEIRSKFSLISEINDCASSASGDQLSNLLQEAIVLYDSLPPKARADYLSSHADMANGHLYRYLHLGGPDVPEVWDAFQRSGDPAAFLLKMQRDANDFRRGKKTADPNNEQELQLAYMSLDRPDVAQDNFANPQFSWPLFRERMRASAGKVVPPPFLKTDKAFKVPKKMMVHEMVDKTVLKEAAAQVLDAASADGVRRIFVGSNGGVPKQVRGLARAILIERLGLEPKTDVTKSRKIAMFLADEQNLLGCTRELLDRIERPNDTNGNKKQLREYASRLALALAWYKHTSPESRRIVTRYSEAVGEGRNVTSEDVVTTLNALSNIYSNSIGELRLVNVELPQVERMRNQLGIQRGNIESVRVGEVTIELVPSKTREDQLFGYVAENCTKGRGDEIFTPNMQVYRIIVDEKLEGVIMVHRHEGKLIVGIEPRERLSVDETALLAGIERALGEVAAKEGYTQVLISTKENEQGNKADMRSAIEKRGYQRTTVPKPNSKLFTSEEYYIVYPLP